MVLQIALFVAAAAIILFFGPKLSKAADILGSRTGMGETVAGAILLGATTSLPGLIVSLKTAIDGHANMAVSNSIGGVAAQTLFIAIADAALRKGNLTHHNTVSASLLQTSILIALLTLIILAITMPGMQIFHIHPVSPLIFIVILIGFHLVKDSHNDPQWILQESIQAEKKDAKKLNEDRYDIPTKKILGQYLISMLFVAGAGWLISFSGSNIVAETNFSPVIMGATFMAIASSFPELITAVSSVRHGLVGLAIGNIVGGNAFDTIMVVVADFAYTEESIFTQLHDHIMMLTSVTLLMTSVLLIGLLRREKYGLANIGIESYLIMIIYGFGLFYLFI